MPANLETSTVVKNWKRPVFIPILKKGNSKKCSNYRTGVLISHSSKKMFKILQARLPQDVNWELPDVQSEFRKGRGNKRLNCQRLLDHKNVREFQKDIYFCFIDYTKAFDCVDHKKLWKILKEIEIPDNLTCLMRNLYAGQEATVITGHGTIDWLKIGKGVCKGCMLLPCLFKFYAEYIMQKSGLGEL